MKGCRRRRQSETDVKTKSEVDDDSGQRDEDGLDCLVAQDSTHAGTDFSLRFENKSLVCQLSAKQLVDLIAEVGHHRAGLARQRLARVSGRIYPVRFAAAGRLWI